MYLKFSFIALSFNKLLLNSSNKNVIISLYTLRALCLILIFLLANGDWEKSECFESKLGNFDEKSTSFQNLWNEFRCSEMLHRRLSRYSVVYDPSMKINNDQENKKLANKFKKDSQMQGNSLNYLILKYSESFSQF